jgi:hypothetical protein
VHRNEKSRALHRLSLVLAQGGKYERSAQLRDEAAALYQEMYPDTSAKMAAKLGTVDFDNAVAFWSR